MFHFWNVTTKLVAAAFLYTGEISQTSTWMYSVGQFLSSAKKQSCSPVLYGETSQLVNVSEIQLYTKPSTVPHKFVCAVWSTLAYVNAQLGNGHALERAQGSISRADRKAISSWIPDPVFEVRTCLHQLFSKSAQHAPDDAAVDA